MLLGDVAVPDERLQTTTVGRAQDDADSWAHEPDSHTDESGGNPPRDSNVRFYPLDRYVGEFAGRHNIRDLDTIRQMGTLAQGMVKKRLRYRDLVA